MPTNTANGGTVPVGSDPYALTADLKKSIESVRSIIPISSAAAQTNLPTVFGGTLPVPTYIERTDLPGRPIYTWDGSAWLLPGGALGVLKSSLVDSASGGIGSTISVVNNFPSVEFVAGRKYRIEWCCEYAGSVAGNYADLSIHTSSTLDAAASTADMTKLGGSSLRIGAANMGQSGQVVAYFFPSATANLQVKFTAYVWAGAGIVQIVGSPTNRVAYTVFDEGRQF